MELTKKLALYECARLWKFLSTYHYPLQSGGDGAKRQWPEWSTIRAKYKLSFGVRCPACEYQESTDAECPEDCIMLVAWPGGCSEGIYHDWLVAVGRDDRDAARTLAAHIAFIANEEFEKCC